uniref:Junction mediating and regulatory protein, p53 cofactor n=1 Tax=Sphenodon punctatus TaxID=8508 RepID=A0A8D0L9X6_SPHPU
MAAFALEETLEADWVAVRPHAFHEREKQKFVFIVAWNEIEGKFAITCHNRTAQRQRSGSRELRRSSPEHRAKAGSPTVRRSSAAGPPCSWAGLFSFQDLRAVHQQLYSVNSELEPCLPVFPEEPSGMWTVLFGAPELSEPELDTLCYQLQGYLGHCLDICGWKILSQVLFTETDDPEEYYESLSELRQKGYEEVLQRARKRIQELLEKHRNTESMVELLELYRMEDEAYSSLAEATTELYQYLLQPFRDMRELAMLRRQQIKISVENDYLGPRRIESLKKEDADWQRKAHMAVLSIQDLTVKYFEITAKAQKAVYDRMRADQKKFGKAAWEAAVERMEKLQYAVSKETLQLMRAKEICLEQKKHALKEEMQSLQGGTEAIAHLDNLEADYYDLQLELYEKRDEVVYYDTYESMEAMLEKEDMAASIHLQREELLKLQQKVRQLEARRGRISAKKAYLRNKKEICIAKHNEKIQQRLQSEEEYGMHHTQQQDEEERKNSWVSQERQKTLDRLRTFKQRYPGQVIFKSTRLRLAHARRKSTATSMPCLDQPRSLPVTTQTEERAKDVESGKVTQPLQTQEPKSLPQLEDVSLPPDVVTSELSVTTSIPLTVSDKFHPDTVTVVPLPPPLPPPPPPPPLPHLPAKEDSVKGLPQTTTVPSAHLFDSSQLVSAKKKLKKTGDIEGLQRRRVSSPMDEVLASLKRGSFHLRKVEQRNIPPFPDEDDSNNILSQIRKGVKLKKVQKDVMRESFTILPDTDPLTRSIHEALRRIKEASPESEDDEESLPCTDWEN